MIFHLRLFQNCIQYLQCLLKISKIILKQNFMIFYIIIQLVEQRANHQFCWNGYRKKTNDFDLLSNLRVNPGLQLVLVRSILDSPVSKYKFLESVLLTCLCVSLLNLGKRASGKDEEALKIMEITPIIFFISQDICPTRKWNSIIYLHFFSFYKL